jgi:CHAD domain-containing protein
MPEVVTDHSHIPESAYVARGDVSMEAITKSLEALLPTRHHPIARQRLTLLDTFDGRIHRAGARLTRGASPSASMVAWLSRRGGTQQVTVRPKQAVSFVWDLPDGPFQQLLAPVIGVRRLLAQAEAELHGSLLEILDERSKTVARVRIESGRARLPASRNGWRSLPTVITVTGLRGYDTAYERLVPVISSRPGIELCADGLDGLILRQVGAPDRGDVASLRLELSRAVRADAGARQIHLALLRLVVANEPGLRSDLDTEFLHDFRVAVRRSRSLLGQIRHVFPIEVVEHFSRELAWIGRSTGPLRDMDVLLFRLKEHRDDIGAAAMRGLTRLLEQARRDEHARVVFTLDSDRYRRLLSEWKAFLEQPAPPAAEARNAERPLADVAAQRAWRLSRRIAASADILDAQAAERVHEIRIDAKKLRYLIDLTPGFYDAGDLERILGALKKLQGVLGDFNDAHVQEARLLECGETLAESSGHAGVLLAIGRLAEQSRQRRERLRIQVVFGLTRFRDSRTRSACRRAFGPQRTT